MALARTSPMPFSVASSFSEAELMSIGSIFLASAFASAFAGAASFLASVLAGAFVSGLGVSAFCAKARPVAAIMATRKAKILFMLRFLSIGFWGGLGALETAPARLN